MRLQKYAERKKGVNKPDTISTKLCVLRNFEDFLGDMFELEEPSTESIHRYLDHLQEKGYSSGTLQQYWYMIKDYASVMMVEINTNSIKRRIPVYSPESAEIMTREQVQLIIQDHEYKRRTRVLCMLLYTYARRLDEVRILERKNIDFKSNTITFPIEKRANIDSKTYEMEPMVSRRLDDWVSGSGYVFPGNISDVIGVTTVWLDLRQICKYHGIPQDYSPHSFRHSRVSHLREDNVDWLVIRDQYTLHKSLSVLQNTYSHATQKGKKDVPSLEESLRL